MSDTNPFDDLKIAARYEYWYHTSGKKAADQEKLLLLSLLNRFEGIKSILDIGCGTGHFTNWYHDQGYQAVGLDRSMKMLMHTITHNIVHFCLGDAADLPFPEKSFDLVSYVTVLEFVRDPQRALREGLRLARRGLLLGVINRHSLLGLKYRSKGGPIWGAARLFTPRELQQMLANVVDAHYEIHCKTTILPLSFRSSKLPWGGYIGLAVMIS